MHSIFVSYKAVVDVDLTDSNAVRHLTHLERQSNVSRSLCDVNNFRCAQVELQGALLEELNLIH